MSRRLGLVLECDTGGPDELVFTCLARRLAPDLEVVCATLGSKEGIFLDGAEAARELIETDRCGLALIVWDLKPLWEGPPPAKNCQDEVAEMQVPLDVLDPAVREKIRLLCLTYELETWLLAEEGVIRNYLSTKAHKSKFKVPGGPLAKTDAKAFLNTEFKKARGYKYQDTSEAIKLVRGWTDTSRVGKIHTFRRFAELLTGNAAASFQQTGDACAGLVYQAAMMGKV